VEQLCTPATLLMPLSGSAESVMAFHGLTRSANSYLKADPVIYSYIVTVLGQCLSVAII